jgi:DNA end-binding protein Ku
MPRAIWSGAVAFGLVSVPVKLYAATERQAELGFRQLHKKDHAPIDYRRFCSKEDVEVDWKDIARGYEYAKGQFVVMTKADFERAQTPATQTLEIRDFVPVEQIDFAFFEMPYWLEPTKPGRKAYGLLRDALAETGRVGIGTFVMRQREHLAALRPSGKALMLTTMRFADELRPATQLDLPNGVGATREKKLARQLIDTLASDWAPEKYRDTYREMLRAAIEQKVEGKEIVMPEAPKPAKVLDLVAALQASLKAPRRDLAKAAGRADRRRAASGRRRRSVRAGQAA